MDLPFSCNVSVESVLGSADGKTCDNVSRRIRNIKVARACAMLSGYKNIA